MLDNLFSKDRIKASDEPARFVSSYCAKGTGTVGEVITLPNISLSSGKYEFTAWVNLTNITNAAVFGCSFTDCVGRYGLVIENGTFHAVIQGEGTTTIYRSGPVPAIIKDNIWQKWYWMIVFHNALLSTRERILSGGQLLTALA